MHVEGQSRSLHTAEGRCASFTWVLHSSEPEVQGSGSAAMPMLLNHADARLYLRPVSCELQQLVGCMQALGQLHGLQLGKL